ncbi:MAG TPA: PhzF family phenazine biosynthesis protein [Chloroflexi bacterium]|nr:PhzF family phenazine biosynthesis protein [Chloroflexota bacterium]
MRYRFFTADVFTSVRFGGNQLAVFPDGSGLSDAQMQQIAQEFNLSETVFVLPPEEPAHTRRLRIFTPARELPFAGHPTVGAAYVLAAIGEIQLTGERTPIVFEEGVGPVPVTITAQHGRPHTATLTAAVLPTFGPPPPDTAALAAMLTLEQDEIVSGDYAAQGASCGVPFLFITVRDRASLARARLRRDRWEATLANWWANQVYLIAFDPELTGSHLRARMFAPAMGIVEDPATGAAAAALAGYLGTHDPARNGTLRWIVEQGFEMGRPSILEVEADKRDGAIAAVRVGGASVLVCEGVMTVDA